MVLLLVPLLGTALAWALACGGLTVLGLRQWRWRAPGGAAAVAAGAAGLVAVAAPPATLAGLLLAGVDGFRFDDWLGHSVRAAVALWAASQVTLAVAAWRALGAGRASGGAT